MGARDAARGHRRDRPARRAPLELGLLADRLRTGERGRYILIELLSSTSHAAVYAAVDRVLAREVAVKIHQDAQEHADQRTLLEVQAMSAAAHPKVAEIFDVGEFGGLLYSVLELCDCDLWTWREGQPWTAILDRVLEAGAGLAHLHERGYAHGDVKATNILIKRGAAKLADFGHAARSSFARGTVGHLAPELPDKGRSPSADVFALAVTTWMCLFGRGPHGELPEDRDEALAVGVLRAAANTIEQPSELPPGMPDHFVVTLLHALRARPCERLSLRAFLDELRIIRTAPARRRERRRKLIAGVGPEALCVLCGLAGALLSGRSRPIEGPPMVWTLIEIQHPLARAEQAAEAGDRATVIAEFHRVYGDVRNLSPSELKRAAATAARIAALFEAEQSEDADLARAFADYFRRRQASE